MSRGARIRCAPDDLAVKEGGRFRRRVLLGGQKHYPTRQPHYQPSTVARFNSVSVIASGLVKLLFDSVMTAWRSGGPNELTRSSVVGLPEGEGDASADGLAVAAGLLGGPQSAVEFAPAHLSPDRS